MKALLFLILLAAAPPEDGAERIDAAGVRTVELSALRGVQVQPSAGAYVEILDDEEARVTKTGTRIKISGRRGLRVRVPKTWLEVRCQSGGVEIEGAYERVTIKTAAGRVRLNVTSDEVEVHSLSGDVQIDGTVRQLRVKSVSGDVDVRALELDRLRVNLTNGDVTLHSPRAFPKRIEVESINGDTTLKGGLHKDGAIRVRTQSGRITLTRTNEVGLRLEARSRFGRIRVLGEKRKTEDVWIEEIDGGGADVRLSTFSGKIVIE